MEPVIRLTYPSLKILDIFRIEYEIINDPEDLIQKRAQYEILNGPMSPINFNDNSIDMKMINEIFLR